MLTHTAPCPACAQRTTFEVKQVMPSGNINLAAVRAANRDEPMWPKADVRLFRFYGMSACDQCGGAVEVMFELDAAGLEALAAEHAPDELAAAMEWDSDGWLNLGNVFKAANADVTTIARGGDAGVTLRVRPRASA